jgi:predicted O-methyltransferase YrrM
MKREPKFYRTFNYDPGFLPNPLLRQLEKNIKTIEEAIPISGYTVGYPGWNLLYYTLLCSLQENKYNTVLETGTNYGCSCIILSQALKDSGLQGKVLSIEIDMKNYDIAKVNIKSAALENYVHLYNGDSISFLKSTNFNPEFLCYAFLDGNHDQENVLKEFDLVYPHLSDNSLVVFDNTYLISTERNNRRVNGALEEIKKKYGGNLINFENVSWFTPGIAIWQKAPFQKDWG